MNNKKGMSLIELLVAMCTTIIVVFGVGYAILYYNGYFDAKVINDFDKQITLGVSDYINNVLIFASDVRIVDDGEGPTNDKSWHNLYVEDGYLFHDDKLVFQKSFYDGNSIVIQIKGFENSRMDLMYTLESTSNEIVYDKKNTLELLNLTSLVDDSSGYRPYAALVTDYIRLSKDNRIYYKKELQ